MSKKLVLTVIDGMKPAMLERAIANGTAPTLKAIRERGAYVDDCVAAFPSVTPVCAASIATGSGPDRHRIPSMNWFSRDEQRYVEYGSSFSASRKFGVLRSLTDTVYNMNAVHLAKRDADLLRAARRRRDPHRRDDVPDVPRPPRAPRHDRHAAGADRQRDRLQRAGQGPARAVLRRPLREPPHRLPRPVRHAGRPRRPHRLRRRLHGGARPLRLHALLAARQRHLLAPQRAACAGDLDRRRRPPAGAAGARRRRARPLPRRARDDRDGRPLAHAGRGADPARPRLRRLGGRETERRPRDRRRDSDQPGAAVGDDLRAARRGAREDRGESGDGRARGPGRRPRDAPRRPARGRDRERARRAALLARRRPRRPARAQMERRRRPGGDRRANRGRPPAVARLPGRARARLVGADLRDRRRRAAVGRARPTSSSTGAAPGIPAAAATARSTAATRRARCCGAAPVRRRVRRASSGRCATCCRW